MKLYSIGFTKKSAEQFFSLLMNNKIEIVIDTRINNTSQLAGFAKGEDLNYFLSLHKINYDYRPDFAPTQELLKKWRNKEIDWKTYEGQYILLMNENSSYKRFSDDYFKYGNICILCSEDTTDNCHRRLLIDLITNNTKDILKGEDL